MSAQAAPAAGPGPGGEAAGGGAGCGGGGSGQVCLSVTVANEQHGESAGHVLVLDESDDEREHERMLSEFLNKHRKADRSLVRSSCSSPSPSSSPASDLHELSVVLQADLHVLFKLQVRAGTFYQTMTKQDSLSRREVHNVTSSIRSGQLPVHVQVRPPPLQRAEAGCGGADVGGAGGGAGGGTSAGGRFLRCIGPCMRDQDEDEDYAHRLRAMLARYLPHDLVHSKHIDDLIRVRTRRALNRLAHSLAHSIDLYSMYFHYKTSLLLSVTSNISQNLPFH